MAGSGGGLESVTVKRAADGVLHLRYQNGPDPLRLINDASQTLLAHLQAHGIDTSPYKDRHDPALLTDLVRRLTATTPAPTPTPTSTDKTCPSSSATPTSLTNKTSSKTSPASSLTSKTSISSSSDFSLCSSCTACSAQESQLRRELHIAQEARFALESLVDNLTRRADAAENELIRSKSQTGNPEKEQDILAELRAREMERDGLKVSVATLVAEKERLAAELAELQSGKPLKSLSGIIIDTPERARLTKALRETEKDREDVQGQLSNLSSKLGRVEKERDWLEKELGNLRLRLTVRNRGGDARTEELEEAQREGVVAEARRAKAVEEAASSAETAHNRLVQVKEQLRDATERYASGKSAREGLVKEVASLKESLKYTEVLLKEARDKTLNEAEEGRRLGGRVLELESRLAEVELGRSMTERGLRAQVEELMEKLRDQKAAWNEKRDELLGRIARYRDEVRMLTDRLEKPGAKKQTPASSRSRPSRSPSPIKTTTTPSAPVKLRTPSKAEMNAPAKLKSPSQTKLDKAESEEGKKRTEDDNRPPERIHLKCTEASLTFTDPK